MREAQVPGTLQVSVSSTSNLNKEGVRFLITHLSDLTQYLLESTAVACYACHSAQTSGVWCVCGMCVCVVCVWCVWVCGMCGV